MVSHFFAIQSDPIAFHVRYAMQKGKIFCLSPISPMTVTDAERTNNLGDCSLEERAERIKRSRPELAGSLSQPSLEVHLELNRVLHGGETTQMTTS